MCYPILSLRYILIRLLAMAVVIGMLSNAIAATPAELISETSPHPVLLNAVMCEDVQEHQPLYAGVVFSIGIGKVYCYTLFDQVPERTHITHNWYNRDNLSTKIKLILHPPRWTTYSAIQLRESDKGPWRVEITDSEGRILQVLRFSVTE